MFKFCTYSSDRLDGKIVLLFLSTLHLLTWIITGPLATTRGDRGKLLYTHQVNSRFHK